MKIKARFIQIARGIKHDRFVNHI